MRAETKAQRFQRLATKRTQVALKRIGLVGNLTGPGYDYTPEQAAKIISALRAAVSAVETKFSRTRGAKASEASFTL